MNLIDSISGRVTVELTSADPGYMLGCISSAGIPVCRVQQLSELSVSVEIRRHDLKLLTTLLNRKGDSVTIAHRSGLYWSFVGMAKRPVLLIGLILLISLALFLPTRIYFVQVEGNTSIPTRLILAEADRCGISFGASRQAVRSEKMKNALLDAIPELQWAGVNTKGCVAVVSVREKTAVNEADLPSNAVSSIVASRDGVIVRCTVEQGSAQCRVGEAVRKGQLLVSGYTDCGISIRASRSVGEIFAQTRHEIMAVTPSEYMLQHEIASSQKKYALLIGKKRINFYKDSGILGSTCDKMTSVKYLTLPGGFVLPLAVVSEEEIVYNCETILQTEADAQALLGDFSHHYLQQQMIAGQIINKSQLFTNDARIYQVQGSYACVEMIGREQREEILEEHG